MKVRKLTLTFFYLYMAAKPQRVLEEDALFVGTGAADPLMNEEDSILGKKILCEDNGIRLNWLQVT